MESTIIIRSRFLFLIAILACLGATGCAWQRSSPTPTADIPNPVIATPPPARQAEGGTPVCFSPRELLPFSFTPDSSRIMVRLSDGVQIFDLHSGQETAFLKASQPIISAELSPDGGTLAWSLEGGAIQLLRIADQQILHTQEGHPDTVFDLRFSPGGEVLYSASHDGWVRIWETQQGNLLPSIQAGGEVLGMGVSPDGKMLATIPGDGPVQVWDLAENKVVAELMGTGGYDTSDAHFSPNGEYLAADLATGIYLWGVSDDELIWNEIKNSMAVAYSPDGQYLAYSDVDDNNKVTIATPDGAQTILTIDGMQGPVWELFFSPDSSLLAATDGIDIRIWQVMDGELRFIGKPECP